VTDAGTNAASGQEPQGPEVPADLVERLLSQANASGQQLVRRPHATRSSRWSMVDTGASSAGMLDVGDQWSVSLLTSDRQENFVVDTVKLINER
jgi:hypothetical protein